MDQFLCWSPGPGFKRAAMLRGGGGGAGVDHSQSLFYFVPQEKNITAKLARLGQVWGGKRYIAGQAGGGDFGKPRALITRSHTA